MLARNLAAALLPFAVAVFASSSLGQVTIYEDQHFNNLKWSIQTFDNSLVGGGTGTASGVQVGSGGNPAAFRSVTTTVAGSATEDTHVLSFHEFDDALYDPTTDGQIECLHLSISQKCISTTHECPTVHPALQQGGEIYIGKPSPSLPGNQWGPWGPPKYEDVDFGRLLLNLPGGFILWNNHPDFSATGAQIKFGFAVWRQRPVALGAGAETHTSGYDNFRLELRRLAGSETYCVSGTSAAGCKATISATGQASAGLTGNFSLHAANVQGQRNGIFFWGANTGRQANPWGAGTSFQCVVPPVARGGQRPGNGTQGQCDGAFTQDMHARWAAKPQHNPGPCAAVRAQFWYRDAGNNPPTSLSNAVEFVTIP
jgi:hypothetical protein